MTTLAHGTYSAYIRGGCRCTDCRAANTTYARNRYAVDSKPRLAANRSSRLKRRYGITAADYDEMLATQDGVCAICHQPETLRRRGGSMPLSVDHDHRTEETRGLLCHACNLAVGWTEYVPRDAIAIALYLGAHL